MNNTEKQQKIDELLSRGVAEVIDGAHLKEQLESGDTLRIKFGIDPTSPDVHLGRSIPLLKLRDFQELGHHIVLIVGDATGVIGDTSDKEAERPMLSATDVERNMASYKEQVAKILDIDTVELVHNADWLNDLGYAEIGTHADAFSLHEFIARDNIKKRLDAGKRISLREVLYPLMQGYDSVHVKADVELGGTDQRFNMLAGRRLQPKFGQDAQDIMMTNLILGTDGRKMSSSWDNTITLTDAPEAMMEKVMNLPDDLVEEYFVHCTRVDLTEVATICQQDDKRYAKTDLVEAIVSLYHGAQQGTAMKERAIAQFIEKSGGDENYPEVRIAKETNIIDAVILMGVASSKSDARRKIEQGGVSLDGAKVIDSGLVVTKENHNHVLQCGKKQFVRIIFG